MIARLALLVPLLAAGCAAPTPAAIDAARRGLDDAVRDLAQRRPRVAWIGILEDDESPLDPESGLVRFSVGCCKGGETIAYRDAYNGAVGDARGAGRLEGMTLERKATTRAALAERFTSGPGAAIRLGGPGADAPGGRFRVEIAPGGDVAAVAVWSTDRASGIRSELRYLGGERAEAWFDGDGTTLLLRDDGARVYATFDLPAALLLQVFADGERER